MTDPNFPVQDQLAAEAADYQWPPIGVGYLGEVIPEHLSAEIRKAERPVPYAHNQGPSCAVGPEPIMPRTADHRVPDRRRSTTPGGNHGG